LALAVLKGILTDGAVLFYVQPLECLSENDDFDDDNNKTEAFPCFFLSCKANARVNLAKTGHGQHSHKLLCSSMYCLFCVVMCTVCV